MTLLIYLIGFCAQFLFSLRTLLQWIVSEKNGKVLTPFLYWILSLIASFLFFLYGYLRSDFAIMLGQVLTSIIYIRNIEIQKKSIRTSALTKVLLCVFLIILLIIGYNNDIKYLVNLFKNKNISPALLVLGISSQIIFACP